MPTNHPEAAPRLLTAAVAATLGSLIMLAAAPASAASATYPQRPVRLILGTGAGAAPDVTARIYTAKMTELLGQQFVVDNRPGAGGIIGMDVVSRAAPDGHTLVGCSLGQAIRPAMHKKLPYDTVADFTRITLYGAVPNVLVVNPSVPVRSLKEFVAHAKANDGKFRYASSGIGLSPHLTMEYFKTLAGFSILHVPYKVGAQATNDVIAGEVHTQFNNLPSQLTNIKAGRVRPIAVTAMKRQAQLPDVPTFDESGFKGFEVTVWYGICGPAKTQPAVVKRLVDATNKALASKDLLSKYNEHGVEARDWSGEKFDAFYKAEIARWAKVVRTAGIEPE
ncbi:MAG: tripartite tricarboxylate transporter substrate binding protein [Burkholderiales bacterium]|nr:tripartite tricarboxylate transporter substrate binding protein [Burkholderiales bacterium]